jgi:hypothetical protein
MTRYHLTRSSISLLFSLIVLSLLAPPQAVVAQAGQHDHPRTVLYQGILHPLVTLSDHAPVFNFSEYYLVGFPVGVNLWKTANIGYSLEVVPFVRAEGGTSRVSNVLIHPGLLLGLGKGFALASRLAFETSGRYGLTPVLNKTFRRPGPVSYFVAMPLPIRFGTDRAASFTIGLQVGITL